MQGGVIIIMKKQDLFFWVVFKSLKMNVYFFNFYLVFRIFVITDDFSY